MSLKSFLFLIIILFLSCARKNDEVVLGESENQQIFIKEVKPTEDLKRKHPVISASNEFKKLENFLIEICRDNVQSLECQEFKKQRQSFDESQASLQSSLDQLLIDLLPIGSSTDLKEFPPLEDSRMIGDSHDWYVNQYVETVLKSKYSRRQLGFLNNQKLSEPEKKPYEFQFIEEEFLGSFTSLYQKLRSSNPWPLQGVLARVCGMEALKSVDQKNIDGDFIPIAIYLAQRMDEITTEGVFPSQNSQYIYEYCTRRNFFTGLPVSDLSLILDSFMQSEFVVYKLWDENKVREIFNTTSQAVKEDVNKIDQLVYL